MTARTGRRELSALRRELSDRDLAIIEMVARLRLMSGRQIEALFFGSSGHASPGAAARANRRVLARLVSRRLLVRLERQIGGIRAGSRAFVYGLGPVGHRLLSRSNPRPRYREPSSLFVQHTLAIADLVVKASLAAKEGLCELIEWQGEPRCWRAFSTAADRATLRPDLYLAIGVGDFELRHFIEVDRGTEHLPAIVRKARLYDRYYRSGKEQHKDGLFPRVLFVAPDNDRLKSIQGALKTVKGLTIELFRVCTDENALDTLLGGER